MRPVAPHAPTQAAPPLAPPGQQLPSLSRPPPGRLPAGRLPPPQIPIGRVPATPTTVATRPPQGPLAAGPARLPPRGPVAAAPPLVPQSFPSSAPSRPNQPTTLPPPTLQPVVRPHGTPLAVRPTTQTQVRPLQTAPQRPLVGQALLALQPLQSPPVGVPSTISPVRPQHHAGPARAQGRSIPGSLPNNVAQPSRAVQPAAQVHTIVTEQRQPSQQRQSNPTPSPTATEPVAVPAGIDKPLSCTDPLAVPDVVPDVQREPIREPFADVHRTDEPLNECVLPDDSPQSSDPLAVDDSPIGACRQTPDAGRTPYGDDDSPGHASAPFDRDNGGSEGAVAAAPLALVPYDMVLEPYGSNAAIASVLVQGDLFDYPSESKGEADPMILGTPRCTSPRPSESPLPEDDGDSEQHHSLQEHELQSLWRKRVVVTNDDAPQPLLSPLENIAKRPRCLEDAGERSKQGQQEDGRAAPITGWRDDTNKIAPYRGRRAGYKHVPGRATTRRSPTDGAIYIPHTKSISVTGPWTLPVQSAASGEDDSTRTVVRFWVKRPVSRIRIVGVEGVEFCLAIDGIALEPYSENGVLDMGDVCDIETVGLLHVPGRRDALSQQSLHGGTLLTTASTIASMSGTSVQMCTTLCLVHIARTNGHLITEGVLDLAAAIQAGGGNTSTSLMFRTKLSRAQLDRLVVEFCAYSVWREERDHNGHIVDGRWIY